MLTCQQCFLALCYVRFPGAESAESLTTHNYIKSLLRELTYEAPGGREQDSMDVLCAMRQVLRSYIGQGRLGGGTGVCPALEKEKMPYVLAGGRAWACSRSQRTWGIGREPSVSEGIYGKQSVLAQSSYRVRSLLHTLVCDIESHGFRIKKSLYS